MKQVYPIFAYSPKPKSLLCTILNLLSFFNDNVVSTSMESNSVLYYKNSECFAFFELFRTGYRSRVQSRIVCVNQSNLYSPACREYVNKSKLKIVGIKHLVLIKRILRFQQNKPTKNIISTLLISNYKQTFSSIKKDQIFLDSVYT